jgi:hypothetical protein
MAADRSTSDGYLIMSVCSQPEDGLGWRAADVPTSGNTSAPRAASASRGRTHGTGSGEPEGLRPTLRCLRRVGAPGPEQSS